MKYLSWDIGIKNLSYCLVENNDKIFKILNWEIINIGEKSKPIPTCKQFKKNKEMCNKNSMYYNIEFDTYCCKTHSKNFKNSNKMIEVNKIRCCFIEKNDKLCQKKIYYEKKDNRFIGYCSKHFKSEKVNIEDYNLVEKKKDKKNETELVAENLIRELDNRKYLLGVDVITIENQPAFKNPKMKSIQMILYSYFLIRGRVDQNDITKQIDKILFLSANNKLKVNLYLGETEEKTKFIENKKTIEKELNIKNKYKKNKELAKKFCLELLEFIGNKEEWIEIFNNHKKRDDLADTFLMNIYQIQLDFKM
mgnify:CR=1 FL=1